tara:strand:- start:2479 stop:2712 length:234 start_codon:yes stop_codon:yes gene_type:complete
MDIKKDNNYQEGYWSARTIVEHIDRTTYKTIDDAIKTKQELVKQFEENFGYHRDLDEYDSNYSWNCGFLDYLIENNE